MSDKVRVLIVEDVPSHAELMEYELQNAGIEVTAKRVETKEAYLEALSSFLPDVILSDYSLPAFDGIAVLQLAQKRAPHIPFIFVSGALGEELAIDLLKQGATDYVLKNRLSRLPVVLKRALREVEERKERERTQAELKRAEETLRHSEAYLAEGQRLSHTGSWSWSPATGRLLYCSDEMLRIYGLNPKDGIPAAETFWQRIHPEDVDRTYELMMKSAVDIMEYEHEHRIVLPDGTIKHIHAIGHPVFDENGQLAEYVGTEMDITERKRADEKIRGQEAELRQVLDFTPHLVGVFDVDGERLYASRPALDYLGVSLDQWKGKSDRFWFFHPDDRERVEKDVYAGAASEGAHEFEARLRRNDGAYRWFLFRDSPLRDKQGRITRWYLSATDIEDRKRAEEALRRSETYLAEAQGLSHTGSWTRDKNGDIVYFSQELFRIFGADPREGIPSMETLRRRVHPDDLDGTLESVEKALREKVDTSNEYRIVLPDGTVKHIRVIRHPVLNDEGDVVELVGTVLDITERKHAEEALRRSEAYLAEAQRLSHTGSWAFDVADDKYIYLSDECFRIFELDAQEGLPVRETVSRLIHPEDWDRVNVEFERSLREKLDTSSEFRIELPSGTSKHVEAFRHLVLNDAGEVVQIVGSVIDITERKKTEAEINSLKNYLSNIINSMPSILVGMDNARTVTQWNRQAEAFTGIPAREAIGKPIVHLLPDFTTWITIIGADMGEHRPSSMEKLLIEKKGERHFYDLMLYPLIADSVGGAVLRIEDVTERARIQELMVQTEKMMSIGGLAAGMAHEINNPLGIITQAAQNIERRISLELPANRKVSEELGLNLEEVRAYFERRQIFDFLGSIRTASSRAANIVANMLQFSRRAEATVEPASIAQIVDQALELAASDYDLKKKYDFRSIEIIKEYQDMPEVRIVAMEIEQVILNLLKNAAQAMIANPPDRKPRITLRLCREDRYAVLKVEDNGPGMTEEIRGRVFEPFFTTKEPGVGTGLGLSVSYTIVTQNHKGLMEVQSIPGTGTVFTMRLPIGGQQT